LEYFFRASKAMPLTFNFEPFSAGLIISGLTLLDRFQCISGMARHVHDALALVEIWICSKR
jgi:hypothetical protein